jgi:hypothetical protein
MTPEANRRLPSLWVPASAWSADFGPFAAISVSSWVGEACETTV